MEQIIATTDFSDNSRAGMLFAIRIAQARNARLIFLHVHQVLRASFWSDEEYADFIRRSADTLSGELIDFVKEVCTFADGPLPEYQTAVHHNLDAVAGMVEYAERERTAYICISTRGAGTFRKLYGTNTARLISVSRIPVLCIPSDYDGAPIRSIMYASDLSDYEYELNRVISFAKPIGADIELLHLSDGLSLLPEREALEQELREKTGYPVTVRFRERDMAQSLLEDLDAAMKISSPSMLVMFTNPRNSLFEYIFLSSKTKDFSFNPTVPLLSYNRLASGRPDSLEEA
mgnify:CR=1 FL=1|jgi:nucleotide-binding universal stress UspA family protein